MSTIIEQLLLQLASLCLRITSQGQWHAHFELSAHVRQLSIDICPADTDYDTAAARNAYAYSADCYYQAPPGHQFKQPAEVQAVIVQELEQIKAALLPYLNAAAPQTEALLPPQPGNTCLADESVAAIFRLAREGGMAELHLSTGALDHSALLQVDRIDHPHGYGLEATLSTGKQRHSLTLGVHDGLHTTRLCDWVETIAHGRLAAAA